MRSQEVKSYLILGFLALTWGSSYILIKKSLIAFSPEQVAALRISISALAFFPFLALRFKKIDWSKWRIFLVVGLAGSGLPAILFALAQTQLTSSFTGILSSLTPLFTLFLGVYFFGVKRNWNKELGVMIGLLGAFLLILTNETEAAAGTSNYFYGILVVIATFFYALSSNTVKTYLGHLDSITISTASFFLIGPLGVGLLITTQIGSVFVEHPQAMSSFLAVTFLALFGTVVASILFFHLVQIRDAVFASMVSYLIPLVALLWGIFDGEKIQWIHFLGMALILVGLYISRSDSKQISFKLR